MADDKIKIRFYSMDGKAVDTFNISKEDIVDSKKDIKISKDFSNALKTVIQKDIDRLSNKLVKTIKEINKHSIICEEKLDTNLDSKIENIDNIISEVEELLSRLIIRKNGIKIWFLSPHKKEKKAKIKTIQSAVDYISKCQNNIISIKNEYNKLVARNKNIANIDFEEELSKTMKDEKEDPLERTINFYMTKND